MSRTIHWESLIHSACFLRGLCFSVHMVLYYCLTSLHSRCHTLSGVLLTYRLMLPSQLHLIPHYLCHALVYITNEN